MMREYLLLIRTLTQSLKIVSIVAIALIVVSGSVGFFSWWSNREEADNIGRPVTLAITDDDDGSSVAKKLTEADLVQYGIYFETRFRFSGDELRPGTYVLRYGMSVSEIINAITVPSTDSPDATAEAPAQSVKVTFIEGQRIEEFAQTLVDAGWQGDPQAFIDAARHPSNPGEWDFMKGAPADASYEGFMFPNTYDIPADADAQTVIDILLTQFDQQYTSSMRKNTQESGMSIYEVVTLASIVEREAAVEGERTVIARLYLNRLDQAMPLQADPTVQYVVGTTDDWWPTLNGNLLQQALDSGSLYDTYNESVTGLPPGPIANPGLRAIQAVLSPDTNDYLYMQAKNDGSGTHAFTNSYDEHQANICKYTPDAEGCGG